MKHTSFLATAILLPLAWFPISSLAAPTDYDGVWTGTYSCSANFFDPSRPAFTTNTKFTLANARVSGEVTRNTKLGKEVDNWEGFIDQRNIKVSSSARREDGTTWTLRFNGSISGNDKISISGEMFGGTGRKIRDCKLEVSLTAPSQLSLIGKAKIAEESQLQKQKIDTERARIAADKEALAAQARKAEKDREAAQKEQALMAESKKRQTEQQAKLAAEKEALAAQARKAEKDREAAQKEQALIAESKKLQIEQQAKLAAEKEALAAQARKAEKDREAAQKEQALIAESKKLQIEQEAKLAAEKEALAAQAQKIEQEKAAAKEAQAQIAEKNRLLIEERAKLDAEREKAAKDSSINTQFLLLGLGGVLGVLVAGFVIFLAVRRKRAGDNTQEKPTAQAVEVKEVTKLAQEESARTKLTAAQSEALVHEQIKAEKERQELALREKVAILEKEKDALIAKEQVAALEAQKEAALYQAKIEKLEQERLTATEVAKKDSEKTSEAHAIDSADERISISLTAKKSPTKQELADKLEASEKQVEIPKTDSFNESKEKLFNFAKNVKDLSIKASEDLRSDETKAKIRDLANKAQNFVSEKTKDVEARKTAANETKDFESTSKPEKLKVAALSFWSKLSSNQKLIFIGLPLFLFIGIMALLEDKSSEITDFEKMKDGASGFTYLTDVRLGNDSSRVFVPTSFERARVNGRRVHTVIFYSDKYPSAQLSECRNPRCSRSRETKAEFHCDINAGKLLGFRDFSGYHRTGNVVYEYKSESNNRVFPFNPAAQHPAYTAAFQYACR